MKKIIIGLFLSCLLTSNLQAESEVTRQDIQLLEKQIDALKKTLAKHEKKQTIAKKKPTQAKKTAFHSSSISVNTPNKHVESLAYYPTALLADDEVLTYIAGTPIIASPYLGSRPAFDGSDYIVNISNINRDIRLMRQRRALDHAYIELGYPAPEVPIIALSGKVEPSGFWSRAYFGRTQGDWTLSGSEIDIAAILNPTIEGYISIGYNDALPFINGPRVSNSAIFLNMGIINIGNLDKTPFYLTAGQMFLPFGRYSSSMISAPITQRLGQTRSRPLVIGMQPQGSSGLFLASYVFKSDVSRGDATAGGAKIGLKHTTRKMSLEIGTGLISSINDSGGMQITGARSQTFGGFASVTNGRETVNKIPGIDAYTTLSYDRYSITAEYVTAAKAFPVGDLSFNGQGAKPQALQLEGGVTFMLFNRPSSVAVGYQNSQQSLALNLPKNRISAVYNISIWKDTVESIEFNHDRDYPVRDYANGAAPMGAVNLNSYGTGKSADSILMKIGVYF